MIAFPLYLSSLLLLLLLPGTTAAPPPYIPTDYILLNCGSSSNSTALDGRNWSGDTNSTHSQAGIEAASSPSRASEQDPSVTQTPYMTARIFHSQFNYSFALNTPGSIFLRLYFYPATYSNLDRSKFFFSVTTGPYALLTNFSAYLAVSAEKPPVAYLIKEYILNLNSKRINITFTPNQGSCAFINGIEVVSIPNHLYKHDEDIPIIMINSKSPFYMENSTAFETVYRLNVGGKSVSAIGDTGMFRPWNQDAAFVHGKPGSVPNKNIKIRYTTDTPAYTAPEVVYATTRSMGTDTNTNLKYNLTWVFEVDNGFNYLLRLHFCEILMEITLMNQRSFSIFINNQTADKEFDVIFRGGGVSGVALYQEYVVAVMEGTAGKQDLWLALHPSTDSNSMYKDAFLNGLEILKLNQSGRGLAGANPNPVMAPTTPEFPENSSDKGSLSIAAVAGIVIGIVMLLIACVFFFFIFRQLRMVKGPRTNIEKSPKPSWVPLSFTSTSTTTNASSLPCDLCRHFSLPDIISASCNFDENSVIGTGGFGNVYRGFIDGGATTVAIKRLNSTSKQGAHEFQTEIDMLSKLRHRHLVSLVGYCNDDGEMILVYDYMSRGTLRDHIYGKKNPPLKWKQRLEICLGAARGLHYLHTGAENMIIHRDVKSTNILLNENWVAKVSDFGLSKFGPMGLADTHVTTVVKGSFGYVDPEYYRRKQLTAKSDVYSFGVVLLEVLCARPALMPGLPKEQVSLAHWGRNCYQKGILDYIMDPHLRGDIAPQCLKKFSDIAVKCLCEEGIERPTMSDVVGTLEFALRVQEGPENFMGPMNTIGASPSSIPGGYFTTTSEGLSSSMGGTIDMSGVNSSCENPKEVATGEVTQVTQVFSEIDNPKAR